MHRTALILTASLFVAGSAGAAGLEPGAALPLHSPHAAVPTWLPLTQAPEVAEPKESEPAPAQAGNPGPGASQDIPVMEEIIAGVLTGSLAAVLMLKLLYGRRRRKGPTSGSRAMRAPTAGSGRGQ